MTVKMVIIVNVGKDGSHRVKLANHVNVGNDSKDGNHR